MTTFRAGAATDKGRVRANNQDSQLVIEGRLFAVADGMGGHRGGEVASALALESLAGSWREATTAALRQSVAGANEAVFGRASIDPELRGMGTTLTALALVVGDDGAERLAVANVGDSRAYRLRGDLEQMTEDHSLVESLVRQGRLTAEEAVTHPQRNILTRALGIEPQVEIDLWEVPAVPGDRYLLCSDGLFNEVEPAVIAATMRKLADPTEAALELVRLANEGGGRDNITCVVVDIVEGNGSADEDITRLGTASEPDLAGYGPATAPTPVASVFEEPGAAPPPPLPPVPGPPAQIGAIPDRLPEDLAPPPARRPRRFTWRVVVFVFALVGLVAAVAGVLVYYGRNTYYVAFDTDGQVTIFKGRPDGFLIFDPTVERVTDINEDELRETDAERVHAQPDQSSLQAAELFVDNLCRGLRLSAHPTECEESNPDILGSGTGSGSGSTDSTTGGSTGTTGKPSTATTAKPS
jgi:protein phosphatase